MDNEKGSSSNANRKGVDRMSADGENTERMNTDKMNADRNNADAKASERNNGSARIRSVRFVYGLLAVGYLICVIVQVFFAGLGLFVENGNLELHRVFANYFEFGSVIMFILSFFGQIRGGLRWLPLGLFALTALQHMTIQSFTGLLPALHTVDALLLFWISLHLTKRSWLWLLLRQDRRAINL
ncbi:DUF6220 domain-containing protein [Paenibacillus eucommiae]|uniref:Uncharacterized protein n=1 Tax=Paenibacillus eucommiae TaxID=1355755 RepID=A0ABS4ISK4_9BACL|nr:DUF6220 domain-containing protein [Paenibacillus eucommiae]MBP1990546.1 hypothetical protein [Paenibacillus eucommiae]